MHPNNTMRPLFPVSSDHPGVVDTDEAIRGTDDDALTSRLYVPFPFRFLFLLLPSR
jgi:hypothetical protein